MWNWLNFVAKPLGAFLNFIYNTLAFQNYGLAIIIFTIFIKLLLLPLTIKQYRSTAKMQEVQPLIAEIQKRYKNDKDKLNQEMMKVYAEHKVNPAGGCLPMLVQMPIILSLYWVISKPLYYMLGKSHEVINQIAAVIPDSFPKVANNLDITIFNYFSQNPDKLSQVSDLIKPNEILHLDFLGLNLGLVPTIDSSQISTLGYMYFGLLLIPVLAAASTFISVKFSTAMTQNNSNNSGNNPQNDMAASMTNTMVWISPIMTGFISFSVPAGLGIYWIANNIVTVLQQMYLNKFIIKKIKKGAA